MKKLILLLAALLLMGCEGSPANPHRNEDARSYAFTTRQGYVIKAHIFELKGCEYVAFCGCITHKGNCPNPIHGRELK